MRRFPYITVGRILEMVSESTQGQLRISRSTFYRLEKEGFFQSIKTIGNWRRYTPSDASIIVSLIKKNYGYAD